MDLRKGISLSAAGLRSGITGSVAMLMSSTSKSQTTLNGLACLVNNTYITYAIQHRYLSYILTCLI